LPMAREDGYCGEKGRSFYTRPYSSTRAIFPRIAPDFTFESAIASASSPY
jgi:hypothetical protein